jgi:hypothetical protein
VFGLPLALQQIARCLSHGAVTMSSAASVHPSIYPVPPFPLQLLVMSCPRRYSVLFVFLFPSQVHRLLSLVVFLDAAHSAGILAIAASAGALGGLRKAALAGGAAAQQPCLFRVVSGFRRQDL